MRLGALALLMALGPAVPAWAENQEEQPFACWFYKYQWAYFRMIPNIWPPTTYSTSGVGTGLMVTDGKPPSQQETAAITGSIEKGLPRGDIQAPPPQAFITGLSRVACPKALNGLSLPLAKMWLKQPEPEANAAARRN